MTWSELLKQPSFPTPWDETRKWINEAIEFGNKYNVIIRLKTYTNRCCEILLIEMTHRDDPKNTARFKKEYGTYISAYDRISWYFEHLYEKLPQVRRNRISSYFEHLYEKLQQVRRNRSR